jgi:xylulokinase
VHQNAAEATGLAPGTPVLAGMPDLFASMLSAGVVHPHEGIAYYGTAGVLPVMKDEALNAAWKPYPVAERGGVVQEGYLYDYPVYSLSVGDGVRWFREHFAPLEAQAAEGGGPSAYARLDELAAQVPPGSEGLVMLPYFQGQRSPEFDPRAAGVYFGIKSAHGRGHFYRALLESWGYTIRHGLETCYPQGHPLQRLVATGGGARSPLWRQIVSDITGLRQAYVKNADGPLGAAYLAGMAIGLFNDFEPLRNTWVQVSAVTEPDPAAQAVYDRFYPIYVGLHEALKPLYRRLHIAQTRNGV